MPLLDAVEFVVGDVAMRVEVFLASRDRYRQPKINGLSPKIPEHQAIFEAVDAEIKAGLDLLERRAKEGAR
jgi:hypothetical protein